MNTQPEPPNDAQPADCAAPFKESAIIDPPGLKGGPGAQARLAKEREEFFRKYVPPFAVQGDNPPMIVAKNGEALLSMMWPVHEQTPEGEKAATEYTLRLATQIAESLNTHPATPEQGAGRGETAGDLIAQIRECKPIGKIAALVPVIVERIAALERENERLKVRETISDQNLDDLTKAQFRAERDSLSRQLAEAREKLENANCAFGEHPDSDVDLPQRIGELRDEARGVFHQHTRNLALSDEIKALRQQLAALGADRKRLEWVLDNLYRSWREKPSGTTSIRYIPWTREEIDAAMAGASTAPEAGR